MSDLSDPRSNPSDPRHDAPAMAPEHTYDASPVAMTARSTGTPARPRAIDSSSYASSSYRIRSYAPLLRRRTIFKVA